mgnify:CR=1 FL=1
MLRTAHLLQTALPLTTYQYLVLTVPRAAHRQVGSILLDWVLLEPLLAMRHELPHIAEQERWARARELNARRAAKARAAWVGFMRARRVRRVGEGVVARDEAAGRGLGYSSFCGAAYLRGAGGPVMFARRLLEA